MEGGKSLSKYIVLIFFLKKEKHFIKRDLYIRRNLYLWKEDDQEIEPRWNSRRSAETEAKY